MRVNEITTIFEDVDYKPVISSWIEEIGYDGENLYLKLLNGYEYVYYNFREQDLDDLLNAESHGSWYHTFIKGIYDYDRIA